MPSESELARIARRHATAKATLEKVTAERDEAIRAAEGEVSTRQLGRIFDLANQRVHQIIRNGRGHE